MANYALAQRGVQSITSADTSPKSITLPTAIKTGSSQIHATVRDRRKNIDVQRGAVAITSADTSPKDVVITAVDLAAAELIASIRDKRQNVVVQRGTELVAEAGTSPVDVTITAVDLACSFVRVSARENRDGQAQGVTAKLTSTTNLRIQFYGTVDAGENIEVDWEVIESKPPRNATAQILDTTHIRVAWDGTLAAGETIDVEYQVVDERPRRGATARIVDATHVEIAWDGTLAVGETIDVAWEVWDIDNLGDDVKEALFRLQRVLGYLGENMVMDNVLYDDAGNCVSSRLRIFDSASNAGDATIDLPEGSPFETGELSRARLVQEIDDAKNDRVSLIRTLLEVADTPEVS